MQIKKQIRILGIDDASFDKFKEKKVLIVGVVFRGGDFLDGILSTKAMIDGKDSTDQLIKMINNSRHKGQLQYIMLKGIALGGFNVIDINKLYKKTKFPVIVVMRNYPDLIKIKNALTNLKKEYAIKLIEKAGKIYKTKIKNKNIFIQFSGISLEKAKQIVRLTASRSLIPEPIRIAHLIATGVKNGESRGRA